MPTVAIVGQYQFVIRTREFDFEPPHVHVRVGNEDWARILLDNGEYSMSHLRGIIAPSSRLSTPTRPSSGKSGSEFMRGEEQWPRP